MSIARQQSLQPGEVLWGQVAASLAMSIRSSAPDEDVSCYGIDVEPGFVRRILSPGQSGCAALHEHSQVAVSPLCSRTRKSVSGSGSCFHPATSRI